MLINDHILDVTNRHFASNYFEARQKYRDYVAEATLARGSRCQPAGPAQKALG